MNISHPANRRKILRQQKIANLQFIVERPCKPGADQIFELLVLKKFSQALPADFFSNAGMKNFYLAIIDLAANYRDAIAINSGFTA